MFHCYVSLPECMPKRMAYTANKGVLLCLLFTQNDLLPSQIQPKKMVDMFFCSTLQKLWLDNLPPPLSKAYFWGGGGCVSGGEWLTSHEKSIHVKKILPKKHLNSWAELQNIPHLFGRGAHLWTLLGHQPLVVRFWGKGF